MRQWPDLGGDDWDATRETVQMWTQVVGKVRLAFEPLINHWWQVPLYVSARGLTTSLVHTEDGAIEMEFDFVDHQLLMCSISGDQRTIALEPRSVASFYEETMKTLGNLGIHVDILARPVEVPLSIPFAEDTQHHTYDADAMTRFWLALVQADRLLRRFRGGLHRQGQPGPLLLGRLRPRHHPLLRSSCTAPPRRRAELRRLGDVRGLQP
jgi:hypothetical protein